MPVKVLYVSNYGSVSGGGELSLLTLLRALDRKRFSPILALPEPGDLEKAAADLDAPCLIAPMPRLRHPLAALRIVEGVAELSRRIKSEGVALVHANTAARGAMYAGFAARRAGVPRLWHVRVMGSEGVSDRVLLGLYDRIVANSQATAAKFQRYPAAQRKVIAVPNAVDLSAFRVGPPDAAFRKRLGAEPGDFLVGAVARLVEYKGHRYLIEAADILAARPGCEKLRFVIVGDGPMREELEKLAAKSRVAGRIHFAGHIDDMPGVMNALNLLALPSVAEHFGRVIVEAMACGRPVVATRAGGVPEIVEHESTGLLVPPCDSAALADAIAVMAASPDTCAEMGAAGRERAEKLFSAEGHASAIMSVYDEMLSGRNPG